MFSFLFLPLLFKRSWVLWAAKFWSGLTITMARHIAGIDYRVEGQEQLPKGEPYIIASNHQSAWETLAYNMLFPTPPIFILKKELTHIPIFGWYLARAGNISVDRGKGRETMKSMVEQAQTLLHENRPSVIFPQGTRTQPGQDREYKSGVGILYEALQIPVIPTALNSGYYWGRNAFKKTAGTISVAFLNPIPPGIERTEFMIMLKQLIDTKCEAMEKPSS